MIAPRADLSSLQPLREPPRLGPGAQVAMVSPSGPLKGPHELERAIATAESLGWVITVGAHALARHGYFAGDDAQRAEDLLTAVTDDRFDGIWCLRGGYGAARLLPRLQAALSHASPKALIGYSDITALHAAWQRAGLISFHGPTARSPLSEFTRASLVHTVQVGASCTLVAPTAHPLRAGVATGRLAGGNLALIASLCGTPWAMNFTDAIVVLEDINEASYRLDRMLTQLMLAKAFAGCRALAVGQFTDCPDETDDGARAISSIIAEVANALQVPALLGIPVGHIEDQWTLPLGALATLDAEARSVEIHRSPVG